MFAHSVLNQYIGLCREPALLRNQGFAGNCEYYSKIVLQEGGFKADEMLPRQKP
ncbi:MAG: hypothetical protein K0S09_978 [Sphingobacteriaceae bacterium]|nr:hypothetical protein [Sphingobacteriaceae bacterium]